MISFLTQLNSKLETEKLALSIAKVSVSLNKFIIALEGDLGSGKTFIASKIIRHLSGNENLIVASPTFNVVNEYKFKNLSISHMDLYRLNGNKFNIYGIDDLIEDSDISIIEWASKLPDKSIADIKIELKTIKKTREAKIYFKSLDVYQKFSTEYEK